jgi:hypothetical protein
LPALDLKAWRALVKEFTAAARQGRGGILCVRNGRGYLCGLCTYRVEHDDKLRRLVVQHLIALDILNESLIADALVRGVEKAAAGLGCAAIHALVNAADEPLLERLTLRGHEPKLVMTCKPAACPAARRCAPQGCLGRSAIGSRAG